MKAILLGMLILLPALSHAYILPTRTILQKTAENAGSGIYAIEQEVQFQNGQEVLSLKETWLIENDRTMRLTVSGTKDLQGTIKFQFIYAGGQRHRLVEGNRRTENISHEFLEKYINFRSPDIFANALVANKIIPHGAMTKRTGVKGSDFKNEAEKWSRLSRTGGVVNYAFGVPTPADQSSSDPGIWIEQDQFVVRKIRLPSQVEMTADNYNLFARNLHYPKSRTVRWGDHAVTIRLISASTRPATVNNLLQPGSLDMSQKVDGLAHLQAKDAILEFYSRFR